MTELVTPNLQRAEGSLAQDEAMYSFVKSVKKADQIRRYSIQATSIGWEVREEEDSATIRRTHYQDWHRVERARLSISLEVDRLREQGWSEV
jgi:hypothetical protein